MPQLSFVPGPGIRVAVRDDPPERPDAPAGQAALYDLLRRDGHRAADLDALAARHPEYRLPIVTLAAALRYAAGDHGAHTHGLLRELFDHCADPGTHPFLTTHLTDDAHVRIPVAGSLSLTLPFGRDAVGLMLAEVERGAGRLDGAVDAAQRVGAQPGTALYLAARYLAADRASDVLALTADIDGDDVIHGDDVTALLLTLRGAALTRVGMVEGARELLNALLAPRTRAPAVRHFALRQRADLHARCGRQAAARRDLERILAEDPDDADAARRLGALGGR